MAAENQGEPDTETEATALESWIKLAAKATGWGCRGVHYRSGQMLCGGRLRIVRRLGEGGMGTVFEALDTERGAHVALKTLNHFEPEALYRFKNEFRSLAEVSHANLCRLYQLFSEGGDWYFTMELIAGECFDLWVRPGGQLDEVRLRDALPQLCQAVETIHQTGKLHRDLKPSNVLVTSDGRVVVLDFGLIADNTSGGVAQTIPGGSVSGTPSYMAPEQIAARVVTGAADVYAIGVMLFEAVTGRLPFEGALADMFSQKLERAAPRAAEHASGVAPDLDQLCSELLAREPAQRPSVSALLERLDKPRIPQRARDPRPSALVGRDAELAALQAAYETAAAGQAVVMVVSGESGMGKSLLVTSFLASQPAAVVLQGRCNEREQVPFNAFDLLVDNLSRYLRQLSREAALSLLPRDVYALARQFPVLERVAVVAEAPPRLIADVSELRRRAFAAFGELIARIRDRQPLCVFIDDVQWADQDSVMFLRALLVDLDPPPLLLVLSHRSEAAEHIQPVQAICEVATSNAAFVVERLALEPLGELAAYTLAQQILPQDQEHAARDRLAHEIAREAGGSPFFIDTLAQHVARSGTAPLGLSVVEVLESRFAQLEPAARRVLELSALAGRPLASTLLLAAASCSHQAIDELCLQRLLAVLTGAPGKTIECYHDRIREAVLSQVSAETRRARYAALAHALVEHAQADTDPELLAVCFEGAEQHDEAARYAAIAAERADAAMAFDRAAELYRRALKLGTPVLQERQHRLSALAEALSNAGRAKEAADTYLRAADNATRSDATDLRRRASEELLMGGYAREGESLMRRVFAEVGLDIPTSDSQALLAYAAMQARLRMFGLPKPSLARQLSQRERLLLDVARAGTLLANGDPVLGLWAATKYLLLAATAREPGHCAWALAYEAYNLTMLRPTDEKRISQLFQAAYQNARLVGSDALEGVVATHEGAGFAFGRAMTAEQARAFLLRALEWHAGPRGVRFHVDAANLYLLRAPSTDLPSEARRSARLVEEAFSIGRLWTGGHMAAMSSALRLLVGDLAGVLRHLELAQGAWQPQASMQWMDATCFDACANVAYYQGDPGQVLGRLERLWPFYERSALRRSVVGVTVMHMHRASAALWQARLLRSADPRRRALLEVARADAKLLARARFNPYPSAAPLLRVGLALAADDRGAAVARLREYLGRNIRSPHLAGAEVIAARRLLGQLLGGEQGARVAQAAEAELRAMGVVDLERGSQLLLPGSTFF